MREAPGGPLRLSAGSGDAEFPLALISPASERTISSTLAELPRPEVRLLMHPDDAGGARAEGRRRRPHLQRARRGPLQPVRSARGSVRARCRCRKGCGGSTRPTATRNALVPDTLTDLGGGACFNDARVQVERPSSRQAEPA